MDKFVYIWGKIWLSLSKGIFVEIPIGAEIHGSTNHSPHKIRKKHNLISQLYVDLSQHMLDIK